MFFNMFDMIALMTTNYVQFSSKEESQMVSHLWRLEFSLLLEIEAPFLLLDVKDPL